ncbi:MAG: hypothetical protein GQ527_10170 [Bacteroidales bacterium]|nr:hypothetical protein [Bacteroidales bacterium]
MENYKELLTSLYKEHAPDKLDQIDFYLDRYKGKEKQFYITQKAKYANKRSVTDSKKILEEAMARIAKQKEQNDSKDVPVKKAEKEIKPTTKKTTALKSEAVIVDKKEPVKEKKVKTTTTEKTEKAERTTKPTPKKEKEIAAVKEKKSIAENKKEGTPIPEKKTVAVASLIPPAKKNVETEKTVVEAKKEATITPQKEEVISTGEIKDDINKEKTLAKDSATIQAQYKKDTDLEKLNKAKKELEEKRQTEKKKSNVIWYFAAAAIVILGVAGYVYFAHFYQSSVSGKEPVKTQKVIVENQKVNTEDDAFAEKKEPIKAVQEEEKKEVEHMVKEETQPIVQQEKPKKTVVKTQPKTQPTAERLYANDFNRPAIFVACFAITKESLAQEKVRMLKEYQLDAHYYLIPEIDAKGGQFFKVVVGPFENASKAYPSLTKVQERINFDAYILIVK